MKQIKRKGVLFKHTGQHGQLTQENAPPFRYDILWWPEYMAENGERREWPLDYRRIILERVDGYYIAYDYIPKSERERPIGPMTF